MLTIGELMSLIGLYLAFFKLGYRPYKTISPKSIALWGIFIIISKCTYANTQK